MLDGLRLILETEYDVVSTVTEGSNLLAEAMRFCPELALIDVALPPHGGIAIASRLHQLLPGTKVIFVTADSDLESALSGMRREGAGYVLKCSAAAELRSAVKDVLNGNPYVTPQLRRPPAKTFEGRASVAQSPTELTVREKDVLRLVAEGLSARDIAELLHISAKTVAFHKTNIKQKLHVRTTAALTRYALREGVVSLT